MYVAFQEATPLQSITTGAGKAPEINPGGSARGLLDEGEELGLDKVSATTFSKPGTCWMLDVNSAT